MKIMSIIGILLAAIGLFFALSEMVAGQSDTEVGFGFISLVLFGFFLALSIVGVMQKKQVTPPAV